MFKQTLAVCFYVTVASVLIGLLVSGLLAPLERRRRDGCVMLVYGTRIVYDVPAPQPQSIAHAASSLIDTISAADNGRSAPLPAASSQPACTPSRRVALPLRGLPTGSLAAYMISYLFFAALALLLAVVLLFTALLQVLPQMGWRPMENALRMTLGLAVGSAFVCFAMAAVFVSRSGLYRDIADGLYVNDKEDRDDDGGSGFLYGDLAAQARSGFSCTVAAVGVGLIAVVLSPWLRSS